MLQAYEDKTGGNVLAIAHNGNLSNGIMFPEVDSFTGKAITRDYVQTRAKWEPLYEATQMKGDGEAHPFLSPNGRVRRLREVGQVQPQHERAQARQHAPVRVRAVCAASLGSNSKRGTGPIPTSSG